MNRRVFVTLVREYKTTAFTPAFFFAVVLFPAIVIGGIFIIGTTGLLRGQKAAIEGTIAVVDQTERSIVADALANQFSPEEQRRAQAETQERVRQMVEQSAPAGMVNEAQMDMAMTMIGERPARVTIERVPADAELKSVRSRLYSSGDDALLAIVVVGPNALDVRGAPPGVDGQSADGEATSEDGTSDEGTESQAGTEAGSDAPVEPAAEPRNFAELLAGYRAGTYEIMTSRGFDPSVRRSIEGTIATNLIGERMRRAGYEPATIDWLSERPLARSTTVTAEGETRSIDEMQMFIPMAFMMLLWISVMTGGQYLLMSTIEEKSSRVMEVLLSAISPTELLTGKIIGQGLVALTVLAVYVGIGMVGLNQLGPQLFSLLPLDILPWLVVYFVIAFGLFACLMAAVGSAVSDIREAQSLLGPIMLLLMFPLFLWFFIVDSPNSVFAVVLSYIPITTPFVMILRIAQTTDPVPLWQMITTSIVGFMGVLAIGWAAIKIFRIGVLMYGKPPSFMDLLKWLRYG